MINNLIKRNKKLRLIHLNSKTLILNKFQRKNQKL